MKKEREANLAARWAAMEAEIDRSLAMPSGEAEDAVNHPLHYTSDPSGVECIQVAEHRSFCVGNALKYLWRAGRKGDEITDLKKARWYLDREIERLEMGIERLEKGERR